MEYHIVSCCNYWSQNPSWEKVLIVDGFVVSSYQLLCLLFVSSMLLLHLSTLDSWHDFLGNATYL